MKQATFKLTAIPRSQAQMDGLIKSAIESANLDSDIPANGIIATVFLAQGKTLVGDVAKWLVSLDRFLIKSLIAYGVTDGEYVNDIAICVRNSLENKDKIVVTLIYGDVQRWTKNVS